MPISVLNLIFWVISRRTLEATWGDARSGVLLSAARFVLLRLRDARVDPRNWRPHLLVFSGKVQEELPMIRLATRFGQHRGIVTVMSLVIGDVEEQQDCSASLHHEAEDCNASSFVLFAP